jgi:response regulator of citrate/malate metabolism
MSALKADVMKTVQELGHDKIATEVKGVDLNATRNVADLCFRDRTAMRVFTFMTQNDERGFTTSQCAAALGISEDVAEAYLQTFANAGLIGR